MRKKLIRARNIKGFTQSEVAQKLGISTRMYQYIESGEREGKGWIWDALEDLFGVDQRELRAVSDEKKAG